MPRSDRPLAELTFSLCACEGSLDLIPTRVSPLPDSLRPAFSDADPARLARNPSAKRASSLEGPLLAEASPVMGRIEVHVSVGALSQSRCQLRDSRTERISRRASELLAAQLHTRVRSSRSNPRLPHARTLGMMA